jgi:hypothetical protein
LRCVLHALPYRQLALRLRQSPGAEGGNRTRSGSRRSILLSSGKAGRRTRQDRHADGRCWLRQRGHASVCPGRVRRSHADTGHARSAYPEAAQGLLAATNEDSLQQQEVCRALADRNRQQYDQTLNGIRSEGTNLLVPVTRNHVESPDPQHHDYPVRLGFRQSRTQEFNAWDRDAIRAFDDCKQLFDREYDRLNAIGHDSQFLASDALGSWIVWNALGKQPITMEEITLVRGVGAITTHAFFNWWKG